MNIRELCIYIRNYLSYTHYLKRGPFLVISAIVFLFFIMLHFWKGTTQGEKPIKLWILKILLSLEISIIIVTTLVRRTSAEGEQWQLLPLVSYIKAFETRNMGIFAQIIMNIILYIPLGFLLSCCFSFFQRYRNTILWVFVCSGSIEFIQGLFGIGLFEIDDILNNILGAVIGVSFCRWYKKRSLRK